jgi:CheY-like chemotaxis protein
MDRNARRVLVIEDDADTAEQLVDCLRASGYTVDLGRDGQQGLALGRGADYVVMTADRMLPHLQLSQHQACMGSVSAEERPKVPQARLECLLEPRQIGTAYLSGGPARAQRSSRSEVGSRRLDALHGEAGLAPCSSPPLSGCTLWKPIAAARTATRTATRALVASLGSAQ